MLRLTDASALANWLFILEQNVSGNSVCEGFPPTRIFFQLVICALGILGVRFRHRRVSLATGGFLLLDAILSMTMRPARGTHLNIAATLLFPGEGLLAKVDFPSAIVFLLFGTAVLALTVVRPRAFVLWTAAVSGTALFSLGCLGLLAFAGNFQVYSASTLLPSRIAPLTSLAGLVLGSFVCWFFGQRYRYARQPVGITVTVLGLIGSLFVLGGVDYAVLADGEAMLRSRIALSDAHRGINGIKNLVQAVQEAESGQRGFLITGDENYLKTYGEGLRGIGTSLATLSIPNGAASTKSDFVQAINQKLAELAETVQLERHGKHEQAIRIVRSNLGLRLSRDIRRMSDDFTQLLQNEVKRSSDTNWQSVDALKKTIVCSFSVSLLMIAVGVFLVLAEHRRSLNKHDSLRESEALLESRVLERTQQLTKEIDQRQLSESAYQESQRSLHTSLEFSSVAAWTWLPEKDVITWVGPVERVFGVDRAVLSSYGPWLELIHPDDRDRIQSIIQQTLINGVEYSSQFRLLLPDGEVRWITGRGGAFINQDRLVQMSGVNFDVTDAKRAEAELRESERSLRERDTKLAFIFNSGTIGDWSWDIQKDRVFVHPTIWKLYGSEPRGDFETSAWFQARQHPDDKVHIENALGSALQGTRPLDLDFRVVWPDETVHWLHCRGTVVFDHTGRAIETHGLNIDISERKRVEFQLTESEAQFRHLADAMQQIVWQARPDGTIDAYNRQWNELTGRPLTAQQDATWADVIHPDDLKPYMDQWSKCIDDGEPFEREARLWDSNQSEHRWYLSRAIPIRSQSGRIVRWFGTATYIHAQKVAEETLEREVQSRTEDLRRALREKDVLFKELHHRVKNNLQVISSLLKMQGKSVREPAARLALEDSRQRVFSMALIHERLYGGRKIDELDLGSYAQDLINELITSYSPSGTITARLTSARILLEVDQAIPCGLILNELVTNALKYAYPDGRGEIFVDLSENSSNRVTLSVADRGAGLPNGLDPKKSTTLGLSIVEILTHQLGGLLSFESAGGAHFSVVFPRDFKSNKIVPAA